MMGSFFIRKETRKRGRKEGERIQVYGELIP